jgi:hypothetical protein
MPKGLPEHGQIIVFGVEPDDMFDADSLGIYAFGTKVISNLLADDRLGS